MRVFSPTSLRKSRLLPGIALLVGILFLTGQSLNCCRVNEAFAQSLKLALHIGAAQTHNEDDDAAEAHPHCHGHSAKAHEENESSDLAKGEAGDSQYAQDGSCLSEKSFSGKPMLPSDDAATYMLAPDVIVPVEVFVFLKQTFERPRPQNKSSPPLYLTTLQILV